MSAIESNINGNFNVIDPHAPKNGRRAVAVGSPHAFYNNFTKVVLDKAHNSPEKDTVYESSRNFSTETKEIIDVGEDRRKVYPKKFYNNFDKGSSDG